MIKTTVNLKTKKDMEKLIKNHGCEYTEKELKQYCPSWENNYKLFTFIYQGDEEFHVELEIPDETSPEYDDWFSFFKENQTELRNALISEVVSGFDVYVDGQIEMDMIG